MLSIANIFEFLTENYIVVALLFAGLVFFMDRRYGIHFMKTEKYDDHTDTNYCIDEHCVRCNKYSSTTVKAFTELPNISNRVISFKIQKGLDFVNKLYEENRKQRPNVFYYDSLLARNVWGKNLKRRIEDCSVLENSCKTILSELDYICEHKDLGTWKKNRTPTGSWDVFHLINQGATVQENQELCPLTMDVVHSLTSVMKDNVFGNVMFSVVKPGTIITPHYGPTNIRLRCHLGLRVTADFSLTVDDQTCTWETGKCLVFDDSFLHSVQHTGSTQGQYDTTVGRSPYVTAVHSNSKYNPVVDRAVLIVDLWHSDLSPDERNAINLCFQP